MNNFTLKEEQVNRLIKDINHCDAFIRELKKEVEYNYELIDSLQHKSSILELLLIRVNNEIKEGIKYDK